MEAEGKEIQELKGKMEEMDKMLNKNVFDNPLKEFQNKMREELLEFKKIFIKNLADMDKELTSNKANSEDNKNTSNTDGVSSEEYKDLKTALEHKEYQVEILKKAFNEYENATEEQIKDLKTENEKLKYRIKILLKTVDDLENKK
ncbi:MAG: hypothetical protein MJ252_21925 [archaeon]|nr:hypothetical protein [archaeon]